MDIFHLTSFVFTVCDISLFIYLGSVNGSTKLEWNKEGLCKAKHCMKMSMAHDICQTNSSIFLFQQSIVPKGLSFVNWIIGSFMALISKSKHFRSSMKRITEEGNPCIKLKQENNIVICFTRPNMRKGTKFHQEPPKAHTLNFQALWVQRNEKLILQINLLNESFTNQCCD